MNFKNSLLATIFATATTAAFSSTPDMEVWARSYHTYCSSFESVKADFDVTYRDSSLPWGSKVTLVSGFAGSEGSRELHWDASTEQEMKSIAPYNWQGRRSVTLGNRTSSKHYTALEFVFKIDEPGKTARYVTFQENGGYWRTDSVTKNIGCGSGGVLPSFQKISVQGVE